MWRGFVPGLVAYGVENCREWTRRGNADTVLPQLLGWSGGEVPRRPAAAAVVGAGGAAPVAPLGAAAQGPGATTGRCSATTSPTTCPTCGRRTSTRAGRCAAATATLDLDGALPVLGLDDAAPGAGRGGRARCDAGRDCVLVARPGTGGTTAGLLAGLVAARHHRLGRPPLGPRRTTRAGGAARARAAPGAGAGRRTGDGEARRRPPGRPAAVRGRPAPRCAAEQRPPEFAFGRAVGALPPGCGLRRARPRRRARPAAAARRPARRRSRWSRRADAAQRAGLADRLGLRDPVHAGGGWDPAGDLARPCEAPADRRRPSARGCRRWCARSARHWSSSPPASGSTASSPRWPPTGLRAAGWAPGMRATRAAAAVGAWRSRRLDALVVVAGERGAARPGPRAPAARRRRAAGREHWRDAVAALSPERAVLVADAGGPATSLALRRRPGLPAGALLAPYGEPVAVPCGPRASACAPAAAGPRGPPAPGQRRPGRCRRRSARSASPSARVSRRLSSAPATAPARNGARVERLRPKRRTSRPRSCWRAAVATTADSPRRRRGPRSRPRLPTQDCR